MERLFADLRGRDEGQDLIEYALLAALLAVLSIGGLTLLGSRIGLLWTRVLEAFGG